MLEPKRFVIERVPRESSGGRLTIVHRINLNVHGGVENQFVQFLAHPAVRAALDSEVLLGEPPHANLAGALEQHARVVHSFKRWHRLPLPRRPSAIRQWNTQRIIGSRRANAILAWSAFAKPELARASFRYRMPLLYREGGAAWGEADRKRAKQFLDNVAGAICNTQASKRMLELKWGYRGPSRVCLGGVRPDALLSDVKPKQLGARLVMGCAARLVAVKGVSLAIHALAILRREGVEAELRIAGNGPEQFMLNAQAAALGIADHVRFLGTQRDMPSFYEGVDILLHPALREPLGNVTIEAAANGCVVVASRVDGMVETVRDGITGVTLPTTLGLEDYRALGVQPEGLPEVVYDPDQDCLRGPRCVDPAALAAAVSDIIRDPATFSQMSRNAIAVTRERFSFERYVRQTLSAIRAFVGAGGYRHAD